MIRVNNLPHPIHMEWLVALHSKSIDFCSDSPARRRYRTPLADCRWLELNPIPPKYRRSLVVKCPHCNRDLTDFVRHVRARNRCEWCGVENGQPHPSTGSRVVLTCAHVHDHRPEAAFLLNLAALCQRCHNQHDARHRAAGRRQRSQPDLFGAPA